MKRVILILMSSCSLAGCATTSFAPPSVNIENEMAAQGSNYSFGQRCMPNERLKDGKAIRIQEDVQGARKLIDNFIYMYRCRSHSAANGRQAFDVPGFLALAGTTAAGAFGAGADTAIAGTVGSSLFSQGGKYYASQKKAEIYDHSLDALLCIKTVAVGLDGYTLDAIDAVQKNAGNGVAKALQEAVTGDDDGPKIPVTVSAQYFDMVSAALLSVERVAAQRLSSAGTPFDAAGVVSEFEKLKKEETDAAAEAEPEVTEAAQQITDQAKADEGTSVTPVQLNQAIEQLNAMRGNEAIMSTPAGIGQLAGLKARIANAHLARQSQQNVETTLLKLRVLQPKLQQCVIRAKV